MCNYSLDFCLTALLFLHPLCSFVWHSSGLQCILPVISKVAANMTSLNLSRSSIAGKGMRRLGEILLQNAGFLKSLQCIDLSENSVKGEDLSVRQIVITRNVGQCPA